MSKHLHRISSPRVFPVLRRIHHYIVKPMPGPHPKNMCVPLGILLRDILNLTTTMREAKKVLKERKVLVDGKVITEYKFPIGLMDVISISDDNYRISFNTLGKIQAIEIPKEEANLKLCKIVNKTKVKGGKTQLNLHDGRNILVQDDKFKTGDTILINIPKQKLIKHLPLQEGMLVYIMKGKHIGEIAKIIKIIEMPGMFQDRIIFELPDGSKLETLKKYAFVIGKGKPEVKIK